MFAYTVGAKVPAASIATQRFSVCPTASASVHYSTSATYVLVVWLVRPSLAGIRSVAIVLMHGYRYSEHEEAVAQLARDEGFTQVSASHATSPLIKLVSRGDTTVVDAYLSPILKQCVQRFPGHDVGFRRGRFLPRRTTYHRPRCWKGVPSNTQRLSRLHERLPYCSATNCFSLLRIGAVCFGLWFAGSAVQQTG